VAKILIDECLHTSYSSWHMRPVTLPNTSTIWVWGSSRDWDLMKLILDQDCAFFTNNRTDFLAL
jgi:hypothetical protein